MSKFKIFSFLVAVVLFAVSCNGNTNVLDPEVSEEEDLPVIDEELTEDEDVMYEDDVPVHDGDVTEENDDENVVTEPLPVDEDPDEEPEKEPVTPEAFVQCLSDAGVVIYGSRTCPACTALAENLGGYDVIAPIYVDCGDDPNRCALEMQTNFVPEIQINGVIYEGSRAPEELARVTDCEL